MDGLFHGCTLCLEPVYDKDFFKYSVIMHRANYQPGSQGFNYDLCYALEHDEEFRRLCDGLAGDGYRNGQLGELIAPTITGEGMDKGWNSGRSLPFSECWTDSLGYERIGLPIYSWKKTE